MDNYVYLVDGDGKDAEFKGFNNNINANVKAPYKVCTVHTEAPVEETKPTEPETPSGDENPKVPEGDAQN